MSAAWASTTDRYALQGLRRDVPQTQNSFLNHQRYIQQRQHRRSASRTSVTPCCATAPANRRAEHGDAQAPAEAETRHAAAPDQQRASQAVHSVHISHQPASQHDASGSSRINDPPAQDDTHVSHAATSIPVRAENGSAHSQPAAEVVPADPSKLFPSRHIAGWTPLLAVYFPFGCAVAAIRMTLWVLLLAIDSELLTNNDTMIKVFYTILGLRVTWHGEENIPAERHVIVGNHVTVGDLMALYARPRPYVHLITSRLPKRITQAQNHRVKLRHASSATYHQLADSEANPDPVHLFPEGGMTNGRGMMKWSRGFMRFGRDLPIVPAAMRASVAFDIATHTLDSSFLANMFWFCFAPWVSLDVTVLPPMRPEEGEGNGFFVDRVQRAVAVELGVPIHEMTLAQKHKLH